MTNSNIAKMLSKSTEVHSSCSSNLIQNQKCHSRVVKSSLYYQSSVIPSRGRHRQTENNFESSDKKMKGKPLDRVNNRSSPTSVRQGASNYKQYRGSPSKERSPSSSPTHGFYAGAKFSEPPTPNALPKPPSHWTAIRMTSGGAFPLLSNGRVDKCHGISSNLKMLLNVPA